MSTIARRRRTARYSRRMFRRSIRLEAFAEALAADLRRIADAPLQGLPLYLMCFTLGAFLASLLIAALLGA